MSELADFRHHLQKLCPDASDAKFLLAVSGGIDSMVMLHLFLNEGLTAGIAHCNFNLRGGESLRDRDFVHQAALKLNVDFYEAAFDTFHQAQILGRNIQDTARQQRYNFFREAAGLHGFDYICTAHHSDDVTETIILALNRKGSPDALGGIREKEGVIVRPLLPYSRQQIEQFANHHHISFIEDSSNQKTEYLRNLIRHDIIPVIEQKIPGFSKRAAISAAHLREHIPFIRAMAEREAEAFGNLFTDGIDLIRLQQHEFSSVLLKHLLIPHGFSPEVIETILRLNDHHLPHSFHSVSLKLSAHRGRLIASPHDSSDENTLQYYIEDDLDSSHLPFSLKVANLTVHDKTQILSSHSFAFLSAAEINFPLLVRKWQPGDRFIPYGMTNFKKIGDFLTDLKIPVYERNRSFVVISNDRICWLVGHRIDQRFALKSFPAEALVLEMT